MWISIRNGEVLKYHLMGSDPGVSFRSAYYPSTKVTFSALSNRSKGAYRMMLAAERWLADDGASGS
ncbi:hypothetical protein D3C73_1637730 [compost metagenome]